MYSMPGTTNGFRCSWGVFSENTRAKSVCVVPIRGRISYAVHHTVARRVAKQQSAFGFWRLKKEPK